MSSPAYIELHARSAFSFLRGACIPEEYIQIAHAHDAPAMALTDVDGVYGSPRFHSSANKVGMQATSAPKSPRPMEKTPADATPFSSNRASATRTSAVSSPA
jgi:hypothetical protein